MFKFNKKQRKIFKRTIDAVFRADCTQVLFTKYRQINRKHATKKNIERQKNPKRYDKKDAEGYLGPSQIYMMEPFCKHSYRL